MEKIATSTKTLYISPLGLENSETAPRHIIEARQLTPEVVEPLFERAVDFKGKVARREPLDVQLNTYDPIISFFEEPSTRTRFSFEIAADRLGFRTITTEAGKVFSSRLKGESAEDTAMNIGGYQPAAIVARTSHTGDALRFASSLDCPLINGGDGKGEHPTQALLDVFTIREELGRLDGLKVVMGGDLANGRTVRSLAQILAHYEGLELTLVSPAELHMGDDVKKILEDQGVQIHETENVKDAVAWGDVVYWTRLQAERINGDSQEETMRLKKAMVDRQRDFSIGSDVMSAMRRGAILLHPLPRVEPGFVDKDGDELYPEILPEVDDDPRAAYFRQSENGVYTRMALLEYILNPIYGPEGKYPPQPI